MRSHTSQDTRTDITTIHTLSDNPRSSILVTSKTRGKKEIPNDQICEFLTFLKSINAIDQHLFDMVKSDFPHLFLPAPTQSHIETLYEQMRTLITEGLTVSRESGKKLLIIAGEEHDTSGSLLLQTLLLHVTTDVNIRNLLVEASPDLLRRLTREQRAQKTLNAEYSVPLAHELRMNLIAADMDLSAGFVDCDTRESFMVSQILALNDNMLFICGAAHIKNIKQSERLQEKYHIVAMNISCVSQKQLAFELSKATSREQREQLAFKVCDQVVQITLEGNASSVSSEELMRIAHAVHVRKRIDQSATVVSQTVVLAATAQRNVAAQSDNNRHHVVGGLYFTIENVNVNRWIVKLLRSDQEIKSIMIEDVSYINRLVSKLSNLNTLRAELRSWGETGSEFSQLIEAEAQLIAPSTLNDTQNDRAVMMNMLLVSRMMHHFCGAGHSASPSGMFPASRIQTQSRLLIMPPTDASAGHRSTGPSIAPLD